MIPCAAAISTTRAGSGGTGTGSSKRSAGSPSAATNWSNPPGDRMRIARPGPASVTLKTCGTRFLETTDVKGEFDRIKGLGAEVSKEPYEMQGGSWLATFADPDGNYFQLASPFNEPAAS